MSLSLVASSLSLSAQDSVLVRDAISHSSLADSAMQHHDFQHARASKLATVKRNHSYTWWLTGCCQIWHDTDTLWIKVFFANRASLKSSWVMIGVWMSWSGSPRLRIFWLWLALQVVSLTEHTLLQDAVHMHSTCLPSSMKLFQTKKERSWEKLSGELVLHKIPNGRRKNNLETILKVFSMHAQFIPKLPAPKHNF